jgi:hypothetical protein
LSPTVLGPASFVSSSSHPSSLRSSQLTQANSTCNRYRKQ